MDKSEKRELVFQLRGEVRDARDCFMRFAFQGAALAVVVAGFIVGASEHRVVGLAAVPTISILMLICRIGIFKYQTVNRNLGYELHLDRLRKYRQIAERNGDKRAVDRIDKLEDMGWEEALRAWRVVQTSIFAKLYRIPDIKSDNSRFWPKFLKFIDPKLYRLKGDALKLSLSTGTLFDFKENLERKGQYVWWNQKKLSELRDAKDGKMYSHFHTGNLLGDMLTALNVMEWSLFALLWWCLFAWAYNLQGPPLAWLVVLNSWSWILAHFHLLRPFLRPLSWSSSQPIFWSIFATVFVGTFGTVKLRQNRIKRRRLILEEELLSIHSCAITWNAVAIVHFAAAEGTTLPYDKYTIRLAELCSKFDPLRLPLLARSDILEDKLFFYPSVFDKRAFGESLLIDRRGTGPTGPSRPPVPVERRQKRS